MATSQSSPAFLSVRMPQATRDRLKVAAAARGETVQGLVGSLIERFLAEDALAFAGGLDAAAFAALPGADRRIYRALKNALAEIGEAAKRRSCCRPSCWRATRTWTGAVGWGCATSCRTSISAWNCRCRCGNELAPNTITLISREK